MNIKKKKHFKKEVPETKVHNYYALLLLQLQLLKTLFSEKYKWCLELNIR